MFFSIIVPTFNRRPLVERCLNSIFDQPFESYEVIVVNDASSDDTRCYLDSLGRVNLIAIHHTENLGVSGARNTAIEAARGDYILFLDDDDELHKEALESIHRHLLETGVDFCWTGAELIHHDVGRKNTQILQASSDDGDPPLFCLNITTSLNLTVRRDQLDKVGSFDTGFTTCEDKDLVLRLIQAGSRYRSLDRPLVTRHVGNEHGLMPRGRPGKMTQRFRTADDELLLKKHQDFLAQPDNRALRMGFWKKLMRKHYVNGDFSAGRHYLLRMLKAQPWSPKLLRKWFRYELVYRLKAWLRSKR